MTGRRLLLLLRAEEARAERSVLRELERQGGDVSMTAAELGVSTDSLYRAAARSAGFGARFRRLCQGLAGSREAAVRARRARAAAGSGVAGGRLPGVGVKKKEPPATQTP